MIKIATLTFFILFFSITCYSQPRGLSMYPNGYGHTYFSDGYQVSARVFKDIMSSDPEALSAFRSGRALVTVGALVVYPGAFVVGWELGTLIAGGDNNYAMLLGGVAATGVGLLLGYLGASKLKKGIMFYNSNYGDSRTMNLKLAPSASGMSLSLNF